MLRLRYTVLIIHAPVFYVPRRTYGGAFIGDEAAPIVTPSSPLPALHNLVVKRDLQQLREHLSSPKIDVNERWASNGVTALHLACQFSGTIEIIKELLGKGADAKAKNDHGETPLHLMADDDSTEAKIKLLLGAGADLDATSSTRRTPLSRAVFAGNLQTATALLTAGAKVDVPDYEEKTPLFLAVEKKCDPAFIDLLLDFQADPNNADASSGKTSLWNAVGDKNIALVRVLLSAGAKPDVRDKNGIPLVLYALRSSSLEIAEELVNAGAPVDVAHNEETLLSICAQHGFPLLSKILDRYPTGSPRKLLTDIISALPRVQKTDTKTDALLKDRKAKLLGLLCETIGAMVEWATNLAKQALANPADATSEIQSHMTMLKYCLQQTDPGFSVIQVRIYEALIAVCKGNKETTENLRKGLESVAREQIAGSSRASTFVRSCAQEWLKMFIA